MTNVSLERIRATYKARDAWWTVLLVDPVAGHLVRLVASVPWITPTRLTVAAFLLGVGAAGAFLEATGGWLVVGAVLYHISFLLDCTDGKIARLRGTGSVFGSWLDFLLDRVRVTLCTVALFGGQYLLTGDALFLLAATGVVFLALFGYLNGAETDKAKARMATLAAGDPPSGPTSPSPPGPVAQLGAVLHRRRIRLNLVSGVEFEMMVLVVGPIAAAVWGPAATLWTTAVAGALLILFEVALIGRFWVAARSFDRKRQLDGGTVPG